MDHNDSDPSNLRLAPYHVRITGPGLDWSMTVGDADDIEVIIKVIEKMTRLIMEKPNDAPTVRPAVTQVAEPDRSNGPSVNEGAIPSGAASFGIEAAP